MKMTQEMLEILIGKYVDGEITPSEQQMLQAVLQRDSDAKELFEQLQDLHQQSSEAICSEVLERGKSAEEIFEQAWQQRTKNPLRKVIKMGGRLRFITGLAAGLVIGITLHFTLPARFTPAVSEAPEKVLVRNIEDKPGTRDESLRNLPSSYPRNVSRNVDWYSFTDNNGDHWLIEGLSENKVAPVAYHPDL